MTVGEFGRQTVVEQRLRQLSPAECVAFVADLWEARGYDVHRENGLVVAERDGKRTTIRVEGVAPSDGQAVARNRDSGGSTPDKDASLVVALDGRPGDTADARVLDAAALTERLWYAVDSDETRTLCEDYLGGPPESLGLPLGERVRRRLRTTPLVAVVALVLLAGGGVVAAFSTVSSPDDGAKPPDSLDGDQSGVATSFPPGVNSDGIRDIGLLAAAHEQAVQDRSATIRYTSDRPAYVNDNWTTSTLDLTIETNGDQYRVGVDQVIGGDTARLGTLYNDGQASYVKVLTGDEPTYRRLSPRDQQQTEIPSPSRLNARLVRRYLSTTGSALHGTVQRDGRRLYRVVVTRAPDTQELKSVEEYRAVALVTGDGFVRNLTVTYSTTADSHDLTLERDIQYRRVGGTTVPVPDWYERRYARDANATS